MMRTNGVPDSPPDAPDGADTLAETRQIQRVALYAFLLNLFLSAVKGVLALYSGSLAVTAGAVDSISDSVASLAVYGGVKLSARRTRTFPLGLYKIENLISVVVALFIFFAGYEIAGRVFSPEAAPPQISMTLILVLSAAAAVTYLFGRYASAVGRKTESPTLIAEGRHRQTDVLSTLVICFSALLHYFEVDFIVWGISGDQIAAAVVLVFVAHTGWELLSDGMRVLLDASIDRETIDKVKKLIESRPAVVGVGSLIGRNAGRFRFLQAEVRLRTNDLLKAHRISEQIERLIRRQIPRVERVIIHYEPSPRESVRVAVPLADAGGAVGRHFGESPYFAFIRMRSADRRIESRRILENPHTGIQRGKGIRVAEWLIREKVDEVLLKEDIKHRGPGYVLSNAGVAVSLTAADSLEDAVRSFTPQTQ